MNDYPAWQPHERQVADDQRGRTELSGPAFAVKRGMDITASALLLLILLPLLVLIGCALLMESGAPVFFRQQRGGLGGRSFQILKFRTMRVMEDGPVVSQAVKGDRRVTRIGRFLRRTSLDELPQLWNVLCGDMSLVGPRPHAQAHDIHYGLLLPHYGLRQRMKPGITGLAQVSGFRGETATLEAMARRVETDISYIEHWSLWLDIRILVKTACIVFFDRSAY